MTRINIIEPSLLLDQHLKAEYREMRLLSANLSKTLNSKNGFQQHKVPPRFTLNTGHVYFFFNKGKYIHKRYVALQHECERRNFECKLPFPIHLWPVELYNDWSPSEDDKSIVIERILLRVRQKESAKVGWYRYYSKPISSLSTPPLYETVWI